MKIKIIVICVLTIFNLNFLKSQEKFKPELNRPLHKGDKYLFESEYTESGSQKATVSGIKVMDTSSLKSYSFNGSVSIIDVDESGREIRKNLKVSSFTLADGAEKSQILKSGQIITATYTLNQLPLFEISDSTEIPKPLTDSANYKIFKELFVQNGGTGQVAMIGLDKPRKIGEKWKLGEKEIKEFTSNLEGGLAMKKFIGIVSLKEKKIINGTESLIYGVSISTTKLEIPKIKTKSGNMNINIDFAIPVKELMPPIQTLISVNVKFTGEIPEQKNGLIFIDYNIKKVSNISF